MAEKSLLSRTAWRAQEVQEALIFGAAAVPASSPVFQCRHLVVRPIPGLKALQGSSAL
jgi:hypothetical protein